MSNSPSQIAAKSLKIEWTALEELLSLRHQLDNEYFEKRKDLNAKISIAQGRVGAHVSIMNTELQ